MNIKTPEEIAKEIALNHKKPGFEKPSRDLIDDISKAIDAERNASLEKIRELEERIFSIMEKNNNFDIKNDLLESKLAESEKEFKYRLFMGACPDCEPVYCCGGRECGCYGEPVDFKKTDKCSPNCGFQQEQIAKLEAELLILTGANANANMLIGDQAEEHGNIISRLEAESKAVRSKTIEECAKKADEMAEMYYQIDSAQWRVSFTLAQAIRALNNGKGE